MKRLFNLLFVLMFFFLLSGSASCVEVASRISDKEIIQQLSTLKEGQNSLRNEMNARFESIDKRFDDMNRSIDKRFESIDKRFDDMNRSIDKRFESIDKRFDDMNRRFDDLSFMLRLFVGIALVILGFVLRMQWQMNKRQTRVETTLETQKDEMAFIKGLVERLLSYRDVL